MLKGPISKGFVNEVLLQPRYSHCAPIKGSDGEVVGSNKGMALGRGGEVARMRGRGRE